jgi:integrase
MPDFMVELRALTAQSAKMLRAACSPAPAPAKSSRYSGCQIDWKKGRWVIPGNPP